MGRVYFYLPEPQCYRREVGEVTSTVRDPASLSANGAREAGAWQEQRPALIRPHSAPSPGQQPHLARAVPRVLRVSHVAETAEQLLHQEQGNLLQDGLLQVGCSRQASRVAAGRPPGAHGRLLCRVCLAPESPSPRGPSPHWLLVPRIRSSRLRAGASTGARPRSASCSCGPLGFGRVSVSVSGPARVSDSSSDFQRLG